MSDFVSGFTPEEELGAIAMWEIKSIDDAREMLRFAYARFRGEWLTKGKGRRHRIIPAWAGDEDILQAMKRNRYWWAMSLRDVVAGKVYVLDISWLEES